MYLTHLIEKILPVFLGISVVSGILFAGEENHYFGSFSGVGAGEKRKWEKSEDSNESQTEEAQEKSKRAKSLSFQEGNLLANLPSSLSLSSSSLINRERLPAALNENPSRALLTPSSATLTYLKLRSLGQERTGAAQSAFNEISEEPFQLSYYTLTRGFLPLLAQRRNLSSIKRLMITKWPKQDLTAQDFELIAHYFPSLIGLSIFDRELTDPLDSPDETFQVLSESTLAERLSELSIHGWSPIANPLEPAQLNKFSHLRELELAESRLHYADLVAISESELAGRLQKLSLRFNRIKSGNFTPDLFNRFTRLKALDLWGNKINFNGFNAIAQSLLASQLTTFNIEDNPINREDLTVALFDKFTNLEILGLEVSNSDFALIADSALAKSLRVLTVHNSINSSSFTVSALNRFTNLQDLSVDCKNLKNEGFAIIAESALTQQLTKLSLSSYALNDEAFTVERLNKFKILSSLTLNFTSITEESLRVLAKSIVAPHLNYLNISWNRDIKFVPAEVTDFTHLETFNLEECKNISPDFFDVLARSSFACRLRELNIDSTSANDTVFTVDILNKFTNLQLLKASCPGITTINSIIRSSLVDTLRELTLNYADQAEAIEALVKNPFKKLTQIQLTGNYGENAELVRYLSGFYTITWSILDDEPEY